MPRIGDFNESSPFSMQEIRKLRTHFIGTMTERRMRVGEYGCIITTVSRENRLSFYWREMVRSHRMHKHD